MKILFFANTNWYLYNFRLPLARYLHDHGYEVVMLSPPGAYVAHLQAAGFRALTVPMNRRSLNPVPGARTRPARPDPPPLRLGTPQPRSPLHP